MKRICEKQMRDRQVLVSGLLVFPQGYTFGALTCLCVSLGFMIFSESCVHWFIVPVTLCGICLVKDVQDWITGKSDVFNLVGIIGLLGFYFFYLAPVLHVSWDSWMTLIIPPPDWRPWLGYMAILNLIGLVTYKVMSGKQHYTRQIPPKAYWVLNENRFRIVCALALLITVTLQVYVYQSFGGIMGYIYAYEDKSGVFHGMGWIFMISESFPILAFMAYAVSAKKNENFRKWSLLIFVVFLFLGLSMLFGGMRGSRSNTVWTLFWVAGIVHFWIRPLNRKLIIAGLISLIVFMYCYGLYKSHGLTAFSVMKNPLQAFELAEEGGRTLDATLLGDLGRSDVQAYLLYCISDSRNEYRYRWGQTYLSSLMLLIPKRWRPDIPGKSEAGTDAQYGYYSENWLSSRVYGLAGEAMLNWGIVSIPFVFALFGIIMGRIGRFIVNILQDDVRILFVPFIIILSVVALTSDSDNLLFNCIKNGSLPALVMLLSSQKIPVLSKNHDDEYRQNWVLHPHHKEGRGGK